MQDYIFISRLLGLVIEVIWVILIDWPVMNIMVSRVKYIKDN
jgi:hypothetical protein